MNSAERIVSTLPLTELWDEGGIAVEARLVRDVGVDEIRELLRGHRDLRFVVADIGHRLRWVADTDDRYRFWKYELAPHLVSSAEGKAGIVLEALADEYGYTASEWRLADDSPVVVAEAWH